jgi:hypothetical protein
VVVLFDVRNKSSWTYVKKLLSKAPQHLPVIILANFRDAADGGSRMVTMREVQAQVDSCLQESPRKAAEGRRVMAFECSMRDCFGLKELYNCFNVRGVRGGTRSQLSICLLYLCHLWCNAHCRCRFLNSGSLPPSRESRQYKMNCGRYVQWKRMCVCVHPRFRRCCPPRRVGR